MNKQHVNQRNTPTWSMMNDNSRSKHNRSKFVEQHGGEFIHNWDKHGGIWLWRETTEKAEENSSQNNKTEYILTNSNGEEFIVDNVSKFCRKNELNKSALYEVLKGNRSHHKGFTMRRKDK